jgi:hypothetical protein
MTQLNTVDAARNEGAGYKVDVSRGQRIGRVSSEWFSRPTDERYLSLSELFGAVRGRAERSRTRTVESEKIRVEASRDDAERLTLLLPGEEVPLAPTHWSFGQLTTMIGAPSTYLRQLPAPLAAINLQYGLTSHRAELIKTLEVEDGRVELRAVTGPDYGRIFDHELVAAVQRIAGNGTGDTRWKIPGVLDWSTGVYTPSVDVTKSTTTLYASDRDVFLFLVDEIEWPIALNLFDVGMGDGQPYTPAEREGFRNAVLALYEYIFSALLSAELTSRQNTLFQFTIELLLTIPSATIDTFIDLMQPGGLTQFEQYLPALDSDARRFFELKFNSSKDHGRTKELVVDRLFAVKRVRTLARMFAAPKSKFDFFTEMGAAKVILINVPQSLLQEDGVEIVGRFFISMILLAAHKRQLLDKDKRLPCFVYIDECQDFIKRDPKIPVILDQARKFNVALILAHQRLQQLQNYVLDALYGATSIKFASKVGDSAAHALARDMRTTPEFILHQPRYHFAAFVRGLTNTALSIGIPATDMNAMPRMTRAEHDTVRAKIRERYSFNPDTTSSPTARSQVQPLSTPAAAPKPATVSKSPATRNPMDDDWRS